VDVVIWNPAAETMAPEGRRALQLARLRETVGRAGTRVPFFRAALAAAGVGAGSLRGLEDLARLPFTRKDDLREQYPWGLFAVPRQELARIHASSGTKGKPTVVGYTRGDLAIWREVMARSLAAGGAEPGHLIQIAYGYGLFTGGLGFHDGAEHMGLTVVPVSSGNTLRQMLLLQDFRPDGLACTPSFALHIGEALRETGQDPRALGLRYGLFGAEPWTEAMRHDIQQAAAIDAVDIYGLSEVMGPGVASECVETQDGPVIWEDHFYPEIIDPETGAVLPDGEEGELVFTTLTKQAFPVIRYRTRDLTRLLPPTARSMRRMGKIVGRSDDMLIIRGVNLFPTQIEEIVLAHGAFGGQYQLVVTREGLLDKVDVLCELLPARNGADAAAVGRDLQERIKKLTGVSTTVRVGAPDSIERTLVGKARRVVDQRTK
jgi:phenylacetate-CoA ligase